MRFFESNDMVKAGCHDCQGCFACCQGMGDAILLDALDIYNLSGHLGKGFEALMEDCVALHVEDGLILPHLKMEGAKESCVFLNGAGRCSIHAFRPGLCRTFPLGRNYENGRLNYFLVEGECPQKNRTKVKVEKWIDTPDFQRNREFLIQWHYLIKALKDKIAGMAAENRDDAIQELNLFFLQTFFVMPYETEIDFYSQFEMRRRATEERYME